MFQVNRKALLAELALLSTVAESRPNQLVLAYVKFDFDGGRLTLTATNIDVSITTEIVAEGESWAGCLPAAQLYALVKLLVDETVSFTQNDGRVEIRAGKARHKLPIMPVVDFPVLEKLDNNGLEMSLPLLARMVDATRFSSLPAVDHLRPADIKYTGLSLRKMNGSLEVMASCKHITAIAETLVDIPDFTVILPHQAATAVRCLGGETVTIKHSENLVEFTAGSRSIVARQLMGQFPQWRQFVPELPWTVTLSGSELQQAIRRASITMGTDNTVGYEPMKATFGKESVLIETKGGDKGKSDETVAAQSNLSGDALSIGFINRQVLSVLSQCTESLTCHLATCDKPMMFKPVVEGMELVFIVIPVSLKEW